MDLTPFHSTRTSPFPTRSVLSLRPLFFLPSPVNHRNNCLFRSRRRPPPPQASGSSPSSASDDNGSTQFSWNNFSESVRRASGRLVSSLAQSLGEETGFDMFKQSEVIVRSARSVRSALDRFRLETLPEFVEWNRWERWKDFKQFDARRIGALVLYFIVATLLLNRSFAAFNAQLEFKRRRELTEAYMEALIPEPTPSNLKKLKKGMWRKTTPKGLKMKKFLEGPDGTLMEDSSFVGDNAWKESSENTITVTELTESDSGVSLEQKELKQSFGISDDFTKEEGSQTNWRERLVKWREILKQEEQAELADSVRANYVVDFDMEEVERSLREEIDKKLSGKNGKSNIASWISKRWWLYRPKLPYMYFLNKLRSNEVAAVVFSDDLKKVYVTMKEGFPLEYVVDIPLDPYLFEAVSSSGVDVDLLQRKQIDYFFRVLVALAPGLLILYFIRNSSVVFHASSRRSLLKRQNRLFEMVYTDNFIFPLNKTVDNKRMYKEVVLGGDAWDILDEIMIYMKNPMPYYERGVPFVRGILLAGPPGTGKTLFARTLSKESGLPFVFASGADFADRDKKSGAAMINELFSAARRNAPSFVFIDEIDAIAGRHAKIDKRRRATLEALIAQLDGEKKRTGVDRFSARQAVIFICATNRPEELVPELLRPGRIDRRLTVNLPSAQHRVQIFHVHSRGKKLGPDVDFAKLVFRTAGYSGADIRNLVNEAAIMSVRNGHEMITQQDIAEVLDKQLLEGMGVLITEEEQEQCEQSVSMETRRLLAVHEAGHILLAHLFPRSDWHAFSQLLPGGKETAISVFYPREDIDRGIVNTGYMKMKMVIAHGGRCAERIVFGDDITDRGKDDLQKITKIAREIAISPGNPRLGLTPLIKEISRRKVNQPYSIKKELLTYKWDDPCVIPADMSIEVSELFTREIEKYIDETEEMAMRGLMQNRHILDMITNELLEKSRLTGLEVEEKIKDKNPVMFKDIAEPYQINIDEDGPLPVNNRLRYRPLDIYPAPLHRC